MDQRSTINTSISVKNFNTGVYCLHFHCYKRSVIVFFFFFPPVFIETFSIFSSVLCIPYLLPACCTFFLAGISFWHCYDFFFFFGIHTYILFPVFCASGRLTHRVKQRQRWEQLRKRRRRVGWPGSQPNSSPLPFSTQETVSEHTNMYTLQQMSIICNPSKQAYTQRHVFVCVYVYMYVWVGGKGQCEPPSSFVFLPLSLTPVQHCR